MRDRDQSPPTNPNRRALTLGMAAGLFAPMARADLEPQIDPEAEALSVNILTRMASQIRVNGRRALFVLDTGAERSAIASDLARALELPAGPDLIVHGVTAARPASSAVIRRLTFGGQRFSDVIVPVFERESLAADGLIGLDVLSRFQLSLDLVRRAVTIRASGQGFWVSAEPTRLTADGPARTGRFGQLILLNVLADGLPVEAFVDSGAQYSIGNRALLTALDGSVAAGSIEVQGVTGQTLRARLGRVRDLRVGSRELGPTPLLFADLHAFQALGLADRPAVLLGADILYRFQRVTLDYGRGRVAFGPVRPYFEPPPATG